MPLSSQIGSSRVGKPGVCTSLTRPASPYQGMMIYETDTNEVLLYNGSSWVIIADPANFSIDATGAILAPNQWTYTGDNTGGAAVSLDGGTVKPPTTYLNVGSLFNVSTGRFTVPIAGYVLCTFNSLITRPSNTAHAYVEFQVNGVRRSVRTHTVYDIGGNYITLNNTAIVYCPANGFVTCNLWTVTGATAYADQYGLGLTFRWLG
jgi:hypothetical protein